MARPTIYVRDYSSLRRVLMEFFSSPRHAYDRLRLAEVDVPWPAFYALWAKGVSNWQYGTRMTAAWTDLVSAMRSRLTPDNVPKIPDDRVLWIKEATSDEERIEYERLKDRE